MPAPRILTLATDHLRAFVRAIQTSAGAADADKIVATNANGVLDPSIINAAQTGANKVPLLDADGKLHTDTMPTGIGADTKTYVASEAITAPAFVNVWDDAGTPKVRNADGTTDGKTVHGFVLASVALNAQATVHFEGRVTGFTGLTVGAAQFLAKTPGARTEDTTAYTDGNVLQSLGVAVDATSIDFEKGDAYKIVGA